MLTEVYRFVVGFFFFFRGGSVMVMSGVCFGNHAYLYILRRIGINKLIYRDEVTKPIVRLFAAEMCNVFISM